ncbi:protein CWC15 homolog [Sitodiplosis mosellana]|uniref:protein CWC15 homolog n=1 Tax=Sitodiplosis mosellana TaxID=263140 RepID=UPI0024443D69|nr:protein CWC15 homolog [Sitodiplosis mosellana]
MTTAARPTFDPARGGSGRGEKDLSALSKQYSSRDLPGHTKLKYREHGQGTSEELRQRDFRKELEDREAKSSGSSSKSIPAGVRRAIEASAPSKKPKLDHVSAANLDQDDPIDEDSSSSDDDSDDDTAALLEELNKIKRERAQEAEKKDLEKKQEDERIRMENILSGNPLLNYSSGKAVTADMKVKRRWDDDVVFKNCARTEPDKKGPAFVNDSLRSEFHKKFMEKYIK